MIYILLMGLLGSINGYVAITWLGFDISDPEYWYILGIALSHYIVGTAQGVSKR